MGEISAVLGHFPGAQSGKPSKKVQIKSKYAVHYATLMMEGMIILLQNRHIYHAPPKSNNQIKTWVNYLILIYCFLLLLGKFYLLCW